jgi:hypothetical protein
MEAKALNFEHDFIRTCQELDLLDQFKVWLEVGPIQLPQQARQANRVGIETEPEQPFVELLGRAPVGFAEQVTETRGICHGTSETRVED